MTGQSLELPVVGCRSDEPDDELTDDVAVSVLCISVAAVDDC